MASSQSVIVGALIMGSLVGLGAYMGLRSQPAPAPAPAETAAPPMVTTPAAGVVGTGSSRESVTEAAKAALEKSRSELVKKCWTGQAAAEPEPARSDFVWNFTFGPDGKMLGRGISESRETLRKGTSECLSEALPMFSIPPPGKTVQVDVAFSLP